MIARVIHSMKRERRALALAAIILLQALCAMFFIGDVIFDVSEGNRLDDVHLAFEAVAAIALSAGVLFLMRELRDLFDRMEAMDIGIRAARGEMSKLIENFFEDWRLTASERDVALLVLKGIDNESIARMRGTAPGTVRAQCTQIYAKAQVDGRAQLLSLFVEELLQVEDVEADDTRSTVTALGH